MKFIPKVQLSFQWSEYFNDAPYSPYSGDIVVNENIYLFKVEISKFSMFIITTDKPEILILLEQTSLHHFDAFNRPAIDISSESSQLILSHSCFSNIYGYPVDIIKAEKTKSQMNMTNFVKNGRPETDYLVRISQIKISETNSSKNYGSDALFECETIQNMKKCYLGNNIAKYGGLISASQQSYIEDSIFEKNFFGSGVIFSGNIELKNCVIKDNDCFGAKLAEGTIKFSHCVLSNNNQSSDEEGLTFEDNVDSLDIPLNLFPMKDCFHIQTINGNNSDNSNSQNGQNVVYTCNCYFNYGLLHREGYTLSVISLSW